MIEVPEVLMYCNVIFSAIVFVVWTMRDPLNCLLKMVLFGLFVWNGFYLLETLGYVTRIGGAG